MTRTPPDTQFTVTGDVPVYEESGRSAVLAFGFSAIFIGMLRHGDLPGHAAQFGGAVASVVALLAFWAFGGYCLYIALFIPRQCLRFDRATRLLSLTTRSPARRARRVQHAFADVRSTELVEDVSSDGERSFGIVLTLATAGKPIRLGAFAHRAEADGRLHQIRQLLRTAAR